MAKYIDSKSVPAPLGGEETGKNPTDRGKSQIAGWGRFQILTLEKSALVRIFSK